MERQTNGEVLSPGQVDMVESLCEISPGTVGRYVPDLIATIRDARGPRTISATELNIVGPWRSPPRFLRRLVDRYGSEVSVSVVFRTGGTAWTLHRLKMHVLGPWSFRYRGNG